MADHRRAYGVTENMACAEPRAANWQTVARPASAGAFIKRRFRCPRQQLIEVAIGSALACRPNGTSLTYRQFRKNYSFESLGLFDRSGHFCHRHERSPNLI